MGFGRSARRWTAGAPTALGVGVVLCLSGTGCERESDVRTLAAPPTVPLAGPEPEELTPEGSGVVVHADPSLGTLRYAHRAGAEGSGEPAGGSGVASPEGSGPQ